jgi:hypothetical protein
MAYACPICCEGVEPWTFEAEHGGSPEDGVLRHDLPSFAVYFRRDFAFAQLKNVLCLRRRCGEGRRAAKSE